MAQVTRREFLKLTVVSAAMAGLGLTGCDDKGDDEPEVSYGLFPQSVASGDPKPSSVILWTRIEDVDYPGDTLALRLQVSTSKHFDNPIVDLADIAAEPGSDHCVKVKVIDLDPYAYYHYRFLYEKDGKIFASPTGRTKTAPEESADVEVRFAVLNCQDYIGRYYNTLAYLLEQTPEPDFLVHVGDYIYETTGDPSFQITSPERAITFSDTDGAIALGSALNPYYAASSLSNYRELYKTYRKDKMLRRIHERFPMINIWDDHEYSDDCHGSTATYFDGLNDETDDARRQRAEQVYFEYVPVDNALVGEGAFSTDASQIFPNTTLYRDFRFGRHFHLVLSDYRSFRPDHLIPEDAFPGKIVMDQTAVIGTLDAIYPVPGGETVFAADQDSFAPYVDLTADTDLSTGLVYADTYLPALIATLTQAYMGEGLDAAAAQAKATTDLSGKTAILLINQLLAAYNAAVPAEQQLPYVDDSDPALERGVAVYLFGKSGFFSEFGSRYGVVKPSFDLYATYAALSATGLVPEQVYGEAQQAYLDATVNGSGATFVGLANSVSTTSLVWDLSGETALPAEYQVALYANVDQFDGFPNRRSALLEALRLKQNCFVFAGDIHAAFVTDHGGVADFTSPAVSSESFGSFVETAVGALAAGFTPDQQAAVNDLLVTNLDDTLQAGFPGLLMSETRKHGFILFTVSASEVTADYRLIDAEVAAISHYADTSGLMPLFESRVFVYSNGAVGEI